MNKTTESKMKKAAKKGIMNVKKKTKTVAKDRAYPLCTFRQTAFKRSCNAPNKSSISNNDHKRNTAVCF